MRNNESAPYRVLQGTNQNVTVAGTSAATANALGADTRVVRLAATTACYIAIGTTPTATTSNPILPAGAVDYVIVEPSDKIAALQVSTGGVLSVTECSK